MFTNHTIERSFRVCSVHYLTVKKPTATEISGKLVYRGGKKLFRRVKPGWKMNLTFYYFIRSWIRLWLWSTQDMIDTIRKSNWAGGFDKHSWELWSFMECQNKTVLELLSLDFYCTLMSGFEVSFSG